MTKPASKPWVFTLTTSLQPFQSVSHRTKSLAQVVIRAVCHSHLVCSVSGYGRASTANLRHGCASVLQFFSASVPSSAPSVLQLFSSSVLRCFSSSVLQCFSASVLHVSSVWIEDWIYDSDPTCVHSSRSGNEKVLRMCDHGGCHRDAGRNISMHRFTRDK